MCKSEAESGVKGGVRCKAPACESGSVRQAYRVIAKVKEEYSGSVVSPTVDDDTPIHVSRTLEEKHELTFIRKRELDDAKAEVESLMGSQAHVSQNEKLTNLWDEKLGALETATINFGESLEDYASEKSGITAEMLQLLAEKTEVSTETDDERDERMDEEIEVLMRLGDLGSEEDNYFTEEELEELAELREKFESTQMSKWANNHGWTNEANEKYDEWKIALYEAMSEHRSFGVTDDVPLSNMNPHSDIHALEYISQSMNYYPTDWVQAHNDSRIQIHAVISDERAFFGKGADNFVEYDEVATNYEVHTNYSNTPPDETEGWEKLDSNVMSSRYVNAHGEEHHYAPDGFSGTIWRKQIGAPKMQTILREHDMISVSRGGEHNTQSPDDVSVVAHEMMHRMESIKPILGLLQGKFYESRTTDTITGEKLPSIVVDQDSANKGRNGMGIPDGFMLDYMGLVNNENYSYEILSVGIQSIVDGPSYGGMMGIGGSNKDDKRSRSFTYGVLGGI